MGDLPALEVPVLLAFLLPGVVFMFGRSLFLTAQPPMVTKETVGGMIVVSLIYAMVVWLLFDTSAGFLRVQSGYGDKFLVFVYAFLAPLLLGAFWSYAERQSLIERALSHFGPGIPSIPTVHPSAWDAMFSRVVIGDFLIITLLDDSKVAGVVGENSSMAVTEDAKLIDIYIDQVWRVDADGKFGKLGGNRGIWVPAAQIKSIEHVWPEGG